ncbi:MAG: hypothetical protein ABW148_18615 [Sedimenticola sp.]
MISAVKNEYNIKSIKDYIELINSIIDDVLNDKYSIEYGLACSVKIFNIFSSVITKMDVELNDRENISNILEVYLSVDFLYQQYKQTNEIKNNEFLDELNFPFLPEGGKIVSLIYIDKLNQWGCISRINKDIKLRVNYHENILELFKEVASFK